MRIFLPVDVFVGENMHAVAAQVTFNAQGQLAVKNDNSMVVVPAGRSGPAFLAPDTGELLGWRGSFSGLGWYVDGSGRAGTDEPGTITAGGRTFDDVTAAGLGVVGTVGNIMAGDDKLFVTTMQGSIYCFGGFTYFASLTFSAFSYMLNRNRY